MANEVVINFDNLKFPQEKLGFVTLALLAEDDDVEIFFKGKKAVLKKYNHDNKICLSGTLTENMITGFQQYVYGYPRFRKLVPLEPINDTFIEIFHSKILYDFKTGPRIAYNFDTDLAILFGNSNSSIADKYLKISNRKTGFTRKLLFSLALTSIIWFISKTEHLVFFVPNITNANSYMKFLKYGRSTSYRDIYLSTPNESLLKYILDISIKRILFDDADIGFSDGYFITVSIKDRNRMHANIFRYTKKTIYIKQCSIDALYLYNIYRLIQSGNIYGSPFFDEPNTLHAAFDIILDNMTKIFLGEKIKFYSNVDKFKEFHARTLLVPAEQKSTKKESTKMDILFPKINTLAEFVNQVLNEAKGGRIMTDKERFVFETLIQAFKFHLLEKNTRHGGDFDDLQGYARGMWARLKSYKQDRTILLNFLSDFLLDYVQTVKLNDGGYTFKQCCEFIYDNPNDATDIALISLLTACSEIQRKTKNTEEEN